MEIEKIKKIDEIFLLIGEKKLINKLIKPIKTKPRILSLYKLNSFIFFFEN